MEFSTREREDNFPNSENLLQLAIVLRGSSCEVIRSVRLVVRGHSSCEVRRARFVLAQHFPNSENLIAGWLTACWVEKRKGCAAVRVQADCLLSREEGKLPGCATCLTDCAC